jgi:hypothetical protein
MDVGTAFACRLSSIHHHVAAAWLIPIDSSEYAWSKLMDAGL